MKSFITATLVSAALAAAPAFAQQVPPLNEGWYFGAGIGQGHLGTSGDALKNFNNASVRNAETAYTIRGGWRFMPYMAIELGYYDLGKYDFHGTVVGTTANVDGSAKVQSFGGSLVGILPIDQFDLYGRIGIVRSRVQVNASAPGFASNFNSSDNRTEAHYGAGGRWNFLPNWGVFAEWFKDDKVKVDAYVIGIDYRF